MKFTTNVAAAMVNIGRMVSVLVLSIHLTTPPRNNSSRASSPMTVGDGGSVLVASTALNEVVKFDLFQTGNEIVQGTASVVPPGQDATGMTHPNHVGFSYPYLYVSYGTDSSNSGIARINVKIADQEDGGGFHVRYIYGPGTNLNHPKGFAVSNRTGTMYVANHGTNEILLYDVRGDGNEGSYIGVFDDEDTANKPRLCSGPNHMALYYDVPLDKELLYVTMRGGNSEALPYSHVVEYDVKAGTGDAVINEFPDLRTPREISGYTELDDDYLLELEGIDIGCGSLSSAAGSHRDHDCTFFLTSAYGALYAVEFDGKNGIYDVDLTDYLGDARSTDVLRDGIKITYGDLFVREGYVYVTAYPNITGGASDTGVVLRYETRDGKPAGLFATLDDGDGGQEGADDAAAVFIDHRDSLVFPNSVLLLEGTDIEPEVITLPPTPTPNETDTSSATSLFHRNRNRRRRAGPTAGAFFDAAIVASVPMFLSLSLSWSLSLLV